MQAPQPLADGTLLIWDSAETEQPALTQSIVSAPPSGAPRILLVEDNENHGRAALNWLEKAESPPDLILSDVMMPLMDGFQLLEELKGDDRWRHIPVVMLTARSGLHDKLQALRTGVDDYLLKPFEEEELMARIANLLRNAGRRRVEEKDHPASLTPAIRQFSAEDQAWLEQFEQVVHDQLAAFNLTVELLAGQMAMSRSSLFRQLKRLTGLSPLQYVDEARFQKARMLLETRAVSSVKAAAYAVGFKQVKNFSQNYTKRFGKQPSEQNLVKTRLF